MADFIVYTVTPCLNDGGAFREMRHWAVVLCGHHGTLTLAWAVRPATHRCCVAWPGAPRLV